jgi:CheY-like chemotaxis protein
MEVWLPLSDDALPATALVEPEGTGGDTIRDTNATTILVVEDEDQVRRLLKRVLERAGYVVRTAASGREALEWWPGGGSEVDLVITDLVMPGDLSGTALARELRLARPGLPIVFMSGYDPEYNPADVTMVPGDNFVPKPATPDQILAVVRRQLLARVS